MISTTRKTSTGTETEYESSFYLPSGKSSWSGFARKAALVLLCQILALLVAEFALYLSGLGEEEIYAFDKDLGTIHMPRKRITWRSEGFGVTYFDASGLQEQGITKNKPASTYRIAVMGDSMVEGLQVFPEHKFTRLLEERLKPPAGTESVQVINFGTSGYSTTQEYVKLKKEVLGYSPDMVVVCYHSRDMFENWSPPDATMTNLRPVALKLPDQALVVDNSPVLAWLNSPRGRFLQSIAWIRNHSRIWGLIAATEMELSFKSDTYKIIVALATQPRKTIEGLCKSAQSLKAEDIYRPLLAIFAPAGSGPKFHTQSFGAENEGKTRTRKRAKNEDIATPVEESLKKKQTTELSTQPAPSQEQESSHEAFISLLRRTLEALLLEMNQASSQTGAKMLVVSMPARAGLTPWPGQETSSFGVDYSKEIEFLQSICLQGGIPFLDANSPALDFPENERKSLFYALHLTEKGHQYCAEKIGNFIESSM